MIGGIGNDYLNGGLGNDKYDGGQGSDNIWDPPYVVGSLGSNDDLISGGSEDDWIQSGEGVDRIYGGPGNDQIFPNAYTIRDFSYDFVDCGSDAGDQLLYFHSGDGETATNCENIQDMDR